MRGYVHPPNLPKGPLLATKWGFCRRDMGVRFTFLGSRTPPPPPPQIDPGYGPGKIISLSAIQGWGHLDVMVYTWISLVKLITKHVLSFHAQKKTKNKTKRNKTKQNKTKQKQQQKKKQNKTKNKTKQNKTPHL